MKTQSIFRGGESIAQSLAQNQSETKKLQEQLPFEKIRIRRLIETNAEFTTQEVCFLALRTTSDPVMPLLEYIIEQFNAAPSEYLAQQEKASANFFVKNFAVEITSDELNKNGFSFDSGRPGIRNLAESVMSKFQMSITSHEFEPSERHTYLFKIAAVELNF